MSLATQQEYNNSWEEDDNRVPFVYEAWMCMGAPEPSELAEMALHENTGTAPLGNLALPHSPVPTSPSSKDPPQPTPDLPHSILPPTTSSKKNAGAASKGKQREE